MLVAPCRRQVILWLCLLQAFTISFSVALAHPSPRPNPDPIPIPIPITVNPGPYARQYQDGIVTSRDVVFTNASGTPEVFDDATQRSIPQGPASDGSGEAEPGSPAPILWMGFCFVVGVPMALAGVRGWRFTVGTVIGLALTVAAWAAVINSVDEKGVSDLLLTVIVLVFFFLGFILGLFEFARLAGIATLSLTGGLSIGIRVVIFRERLLLQSESLYALNWVIAGAFAVLHGLAMVWLQRAVIVLSCASVGTFLAFLGVDLILNQQNGISRGLRFLFDRNSNHLADIMTKGYDPPFSTIILLIVSLGLIPVLAFAQHKIFKQPFTRRGPPPDDEALRIDFPAGLDEKRTRSNFFSGVWDGKFGRSGRFSL